MFSTRSLYHEKSHHTNYLTGFWASTGFMWAESCHMSLESIERCIKTRWDALACYSYDYYTHWNFLKSCGTYTPNGTERVKRQIGYPKRSSNHLVCYLLDRFTFDNLFNLSFLKFFSWCCNSTSPCLIKLKNFMRGFSKMSKHAQFVCSNKYNIYNFFDNDFDAVNSRIRYVQDREPTSWVI